MQGSPPDALGPAETYQIDSDEYDSDADDDNIPDEEYDRIVEEGAYESEMEYFELTRQLRKATRPMKSLLWSMSSRSEVLSPSFGPMCRRRWIRALVQARLHPLERCASCSWASE